MGLLDVDVEAKPGKEGRQRQRPSIFATRYVESSLWREPMHDSVLQAELWPLEVVET